jgi:tight adherence protein C
MRLLAALGARGRAALKLSPPRDLSARLAAAGYPGGLGERELMAAKLASALAGAAGGAMLGAVAPGRLGIALALAGPVAGFLAPDRWLAKRARRRAEEALRELPALLDLLRVTVEAGLPLAAALAEVGRRSRGPLAEEWRRVGRETGLGVPLAASLAGTVERLPLPEVETLVAALDRAARHGAPLASTLAGQAEGARLARRRRIQEEAARAGPKIQLVVALLLVPSVLLLVAAALVAALLGGGGVPL